ncbi:MAG TPA: S41 family peptidase [Blastocatellia bacterium]|nr:S41 family peptidase [Blastocatellia bacterium]
MPEFDLFNQGVDDMFGKAAKYETLILDLRGNPGGSVETLSRMVGYLFDHDVKIAELKGRKDSKPMMAKPHSHGFSGKLIVLIDSQSASAAEVLARLVQLEKRGTVLGDRSAGAVMQAERFSLNWARTR